MFFMDKIIDFILIVGFFAILIWAIFEYLPVIHKIINVLL